MISRKTIALSLATILVSASAAMAATTHPRSDRVTHRHAENATEAQASYAAAPGWRNQAGPYYYDADDNGSVWAFYPGYVRSPGGELSAVAQPCAQF